MRREERWRERPAEFLARLGAHYGIADWESMTLRAFVAAVRQRIASAR